MRTIKAATFAYARKWSVSVIKSGITKDVSKTGTIAYVYTVNVHDRENTGSGDKTSREHVGLAICVKWLKIFTFSAN